MSDTASIHPHFMVTGNVMKVHGDSYEDSKWLRVHLHSLELEATSFSKSFRARPSATSTDLCLEGLPCVQILTEADFPSLSF